MAGASLKTLLVRKVSLLLPLLSAVNLLNFDTEACCYRHVFTNSTMFKNQQNCLILQFYNRATTFAYSQLSKGAVVIRPKVDMSVTRPSTVRNKT